MVSMYMPKMIEKEPDWLNWVCRYEASVMEITAAAEWAALAKELFDLKHILLPGFPDSSQDAFEIKVRHILHSTVNWSTTTEGLQVVHVEHAIQLTERMMELAPGHNAYGTTGVRLKRLKSNLGSEAVKRDLVQKAVEQSENVDDTSKIMQLASTLEVITGVDLSCVSEKLISVCQVALKGMTEESFRKLEGPDAQKAFDNFITVTDAAKLIKERQTFTAVKDVDAVFRSRRSFEAMGASIEEAVQVEHADDIFANFHRNYTKATVSLSHIRDTKEECFENFIDGDALKECGAVIEQIAEVAVQKQNDILTHCATKVQEKAFTDADWKTNWATGAKNWDEMKTKAEATILSVGSRDIKDANHALKEVLITYFCCPWNLNTTLFIYPAPVRVFVTKGFHQSEDFEAELRVQGGDASRQFRPAHCLRRDFKVFLLYDGEDQPRVEAFQSR